MPIFLIVFMTLAHAAASSCPQRIHTKQALAKPVAGYQSFIRPGSVVILEGVSYYDGHPKGLADLAPDNKDTDEDPVWTFGDGQEIWQVCRYQGSVVSLTKKLPKGTKKCAVKFSKVVHPQVDSIDCQ